MTHTRTKISKGPNGFTLTVRSTRLPSIYAQRAKLPSAEEARHLVPQLQEHVGRMVDQVQHRRRVSA